MTNKHLMQEDLLLLSSIKRTLIPIVAILVLGAICLFVTAALITRAHTPNLVPYVVTLDKQGVVLKQGIVNRQQDIPRQAIASEIANFVSCIRTVSKDKEYLKNNLTKAYSHILNDSNAKNKLDKLFKKANPFLKAEKVTIYTSINNVVELSKNTYQIDWTETSQDTLSKESKDKYRAIINYEIKKNFNFEDEASTLLNPLNIYITDFFISNIFE